MKNRATFAIIALSVTCFGLAFAADRAIPTIPNESSDATVYRGSGLLMPRLDEISGRGGDGFVEQRNNPLFGYQSRSAYVTKVQADKVAHSASPPAASTDSDNRRPWGVVWLIVGGLTGSAVTVALGKWRQAIQRRRRVSAVLAACLAQNQRPAAQSLPFIVSEQKAVETRRAA